MNSSNFDPWEHLPPGLTIERVPLEHCPGYTLDDTIWLDDSLTHVEQRCTLTHELVHHARGHSGHQKAGVERKVRYETALLLLPTIDYHEPDLPVWFMAEEYGVTEAVMRDRLKIEQHRHKQQTRKTQAGTNHRDADNPQNQKEQ